MTGEPPTDPPAPENPLEAVFERAVQPFPDGASLRESLPPDTLVMVMRKDDEVPTATRELGGGGTMTIPVLSALKDSRVAGRHRAGEFDFSALKDDEIAVAFLERAGRPADLRIITRTAGGALLSADLGGMLDALKTMVDTPAFKAFPGGDFLVEALTGGIEAAKNELLKAVSKPDASGRTLAEQFRERSPPKARGSSRRRRGS